STARCRRSRTASGCRSRRARRTRWLRTARCCMPDAPVRRVTPGDWRRIRALRFEALRDPMAQVAFLETVERAEARPDEEWRGRTAAHAEGGESAQFVAEAG